MIDVFFNRDGLAQKLEAGCGSPALAMLIRLFLMGLAVPLHAPAQTLPDQLSVSQVLGLDSVRGLVAMGVLMPVPWVCNAVKTVVVKSLLQIVPVGGTWKVSRGGELLLATDLPQVDMQPRISLGAHLLIMLNMICPGLPDVSCGTSDVTFISIYETHTLDTLSCHRFLRYIGPDSLGLRACPQILSGMIAATREAGDGSSSPSSPPQPTWRQALDLCSGSGVQGLSALWCGLADRAVLVEANERAVRMARFNAVLNGLERRMEILVSQPYITLTLRIPQCIILSILI